MIAVTVVYGAMRLRNSLTIKKFHSNHSPSSEQHLLDVKLNGEHIDVSSRDVVKNTQVLKTEKDTKQFIQASMDLHHT